MELATYNKNLETQQTRLDQFREGLDFQTARLSDARETLQAAEDNRARAKLQEQNDNYNNLKGSFDENTVKMNALWARDDAGELAQADYEGPEGLFALEAAYFDQ